MKTVHKYPLADIGQDVSTFEGAKFIHVAEQHGSITVWAEVNTLARECMRSLHVVGTGTPVPHDADHVGSVLVEQGRFVFHVYAVRE